MTHELLMIAVILLAGCVLPIEKNNQGDYSEEPPQSSRMGFEDNETAEFMRTHYGMEGDQDVFARIPPIPSSFENEKEKMRRGDTTGLLETSYEAYIQPEFYPTFHQAGKKTWIETNKKGGKSIGIMSTPAEQYATITGEGDQPIETVLFIAGSWGATEYQALRLQPEITPDANITVEIEPSQIRLGPTFPQFTPEWAQKVRVRITIPGELENGTYTITIRTAPPTLGEDEYNYVNADTGIGPANGLATLKLTK